MRSRTIECYAGFARKAGIHNLLEAMLCEERAFDLRERRMERRDHEESLVVVARVVGHCSGYESCSIRSLP